MSEPTMSQFATELDCLRARDKYFTELVEELQRNNAILVDALITLRDDSKGVGGWSSLTGLKVEQALSATSADSAAWLEQKHVEWLGKPVAFVPVEDLKQIPNGQVLPMDNFSIRAYAIPSFGDDVPVYALPTKEIAG